MENKNNKNIVSFDIGKAIEKMREKKREKTKEEKLPRVYRKIKIPENKNL